MSDAESKQIERMKSILADQKSAFRADRQRSLAERKADLAKIARLHFHNHLRKRLHYRF